MVAPGTRREARERAVELLYEAETKGLHPGVVMAALPLPTDPYAVELATGVVDHQIEIDHLLDRYARGWSVGRMAAMDRTVLRVGVLELATQPDVPAGVCLSEAVELGGQYGSTDETSKFVNGLLARIAQDLRPGRSGGDETCSWLQTDVVVFDMDGVIRHWGGKVIEDFEADHDLAPGSVAAVAFGDPIFHQVTVGELSPEEWAGAIGAGLARAHPGVSADAGAQMWLSTDWTVDDDVVALADGLRRAGQRTAVFSNATTRLEADMDTMGVSELFDVIVNSARMGLAKPDVAAFDAAAELIGAPPQRLLFIDDRAENVSGAIQAGWHAVQMRDAEALAQVLSRLRIPGAPEST